MKRLNRNDTLREILRALERMRSKRLASYYLYANGAPDLANVLAYHANYSEHVAEGAFCSHRRFDLGGRRFRYDEAIFNTVVFNVAEDYRFKENDELNQARRYRFILGYVRRALYDLDALPVYVERHMLHLRGIAEELAADMAEEDALAA